MYIVSMFSLFFFFVFFFKQKTAYEMRISDWSSDVCSSDLPQVAPVVFFNLQSPTLDIPMRVEVPLRALLKGGRKLQGTYSVYLHALLTDVGEELDRKSVV